MGHLPAQHKGLTSGFELSQPEVICFITVIRSFKNAEPARVDWTGICPAQAAFYIP
jgi:hypothetical protein